MFRTATNMQLDAAFERFASENGMTSMYRLAGPSSMDCSHNANQDGIETCVVTTRGHAGSMPAALARH